MDSFRLERDLETGSIKGWCGACCTEQEWSPGLERCLEWCCFPRHWKRAEWRWNQGASSEYWLVAGATTTRVEHNARSGRDGRVGDVRHVRAEREFPVARLLSPLRAAREGSKRLMLAFGGDRDAAMLGRCRGSSRDHHRVRLHVLPRARLGWTRSEYYECEGLRMVGVARWR